MGRTGCHVPRWGPLPAGECCEDLFSKPHQVAGTKFAIDGRVQMRQPARPPGDLEANPDRPDVLCLVRTLLVDGATLDRSGAARVWLARFGVSITDPPIHLVCGIAPTALAATFSVQRRPAPSPTMTCTERTAWAHIKRGQNHSSKFQPTSQCYHREAGDHRPCDEQGGYPSTSRFGFGSRRAGHLHAAVEHLARQVENEIRVQQWQRARCVQPRMLVVRQRKRQGGKVVPQLLWSARPEKK